MAERPDPVNRPVTVRRVASVVAGGVAAISGGGVGCLLLLLVLVAPIIVLAFAVFGQGLIAILFER